MNIQEIYKLAISMGIKADFRSKEKIEKMLQREKDKFAELTGQKKEFFDKERLVNPYLDSRIHFDRGSKQIKKIMAGIDIDTSELMMSRYLSNHNPKGGIDLVIGHHPEGKALADLSDVMHLQADLLSQYGVPINVAEGLMKVRIGEVSRGVSASNHFKEVDAARLLGMNFMNVHTPADNLVARFVENKITKDKPETVGEVLKSLLEIPEYREAQLRGAGPRLFTGSEDNSVGKIAFSEITGGTSGSAKMYEKLSHAGVGTIISMHQSEEHRKQAEAAHINVVIAGHISSDSLGMNLFLDELEKKGIEIVPCSGLIRVSRVKKVTKK
jgi:putative NIF3 family GTP cyclohydrolase 1 type 2